MSAAVTRFAPSPNGLLHAGHALSAIIAHDTARQAGGRFLLRIEDIDVARARPEFMQAIFDDLGWLGLSWEQPVLVQSQHFPDYLAAADQLIAQGLLYPCFASRTDIAAAADPSRTDPDGAPLYPGLWKDASADAVAVRISGGEAPAMRIDMEAALRAVQAKLGAAALTFTEIDADGVMREVVADPARWGDAIIVRKDVPASYHLAVVVDDARQGVTLVTRGADLFAATDLQRLLQVLLGLPEPKYSHHRLVCWSDGRKLSKSKGDMGLRALREEGASAADIRRVIGLADAVPV
ncbi:MAG TPA: tRNA glutamyl-Q(34) synthetase GluQRS [Hyphomicrobium sp.]|nr:tRNA glutamyl-Q(34) synthetase GluQRS [Hyphomicrobium sp.]